MMSSTYVHENLKAYFMPFQFKLACHCIIIFVLPMAAVGQSTFEFQNRNAFAGVDAPIFDGNGLPLSGSIYVAELWGGPTATSLAPAVDYEHGRGRLVAPFGAAGYFFTTRTAYLLNVPAGFPASVEVRAWDTRFGLTYEEAAERALGGYGESAVLQLLGGDPASLILPTPLTGLQSFNLRPIIPEPSPLALLVLGSFVLGVGLVAANARRGQKRQKPNEAVHDHMACSRFSKHFSWMDRRFDLSSRPQADIRFGKMTW